MGSGGMTSEQWVSPESLTMALKRAGALGDGRVCSVAADNARSTVLSRIVRLRVSYEGEADGAPATLILKTGLPERMTGEWSGGRREVEFYREIAAATPPGVLPRCFEAEWDETTHRWRLLLEDLGESHQIVTTWPLPPTRADCEPILTAWARFHAHWWDDPRLGRSIGRWDDADALDARFKRLRAKVAEFEERLGDRLPRERRELYALLLERGPRLMERIDGRRGVTIVHGDAHVWNCFVSRDGDADIRLFDWDSWRLGVAAEDLAYMMAVHWYPDRRRELEQPLLDVYHAAVCAHGVAGYGRRALDDDYRWAALWRIMTPVLQAGANIPTVIWWNNFERIHMAVEDLRCRELLE